jgi:hypothetical protein
VGNEISVGGNSIVNVDDDEALRQLLSNHSRKANVPGRFGWTNKVEGEESAVGLGGSRAADWEG